MQYPFIRPQYYFSLFKDIVGFVKQPHNQPNLEKSAKWKTYDTIGLFIVKMILLIPLILLFAVFEGPENIQKSNMAERFSPIALLVIGGMILPLVEEIAFRLSLVFHPIYFSLSSSALMYYFLTKAIFYTKISAVDESFATRVLIAIATGIFLSFILHIKVIKEKMTKFWATHFRSIFYITCLIFAWMHITKYELIWLNVLLLPILTLPQLMSAIIYAYTRVSFGFKYPLFLHIAMNTVAIGISLLPFAD
ncbi:MAG: hypothetical protein ACPG49_10170 [Chitinophagales bacterium]